MARWISPSEVRNKLRQIEQQQRRAVDKYNQTVRQYNQKLKQNIDGYNREVRPHNARVRANCDRLRSELVRLSRQPTTIRLYVTYRTSVETLHESYLRLERRYEAQAHSGISDRIVDLSERETANSLEVTNRLLGKDTYPAEYTDNLQDAVLVDQLRRISVDLDDRWRGAVFALNPRNS